MKITRGNAEETLAKLIVNYNLTHSEVAEGADVSRATISKIVGGLVVPQPITILKLNQFFESISI